MGNHINPNAIQKPYLLLPINDSLTFLTKWKKITVKSFYNSYEYQSSPYINLSISELMKITKYSQIELHHDVILKYFSNTLNKTINILELISVIITYSMTDIEEKVELAMMVFDFDHSNKLSKDEMKIMCKCFLKGIKTAVGDSKYLNTNEENYLSEAFKNADINFDGQLVKSE